jgi:hypothetical protein
MSTRFAMEVTSLLSFNHDRWMTDIAGKPHPDNQPRFSPHDVRILLQRAASRQVDWVQPMPRIKVLNDDDITVLQINDRTFGLSPNEVAFLRLLLIEYDEFEHLKGADAESRERKEQEKSLTSKEVRQAVTNYINKYHSLKEAVSLEPRIRDILETAASQKPGSEYDRWEVYSQLKEQVSELVGFGAENEELRTQGFYEAVVGAIHDLLPGVS